MTTPTYRPGRYRFDAATRSWHSGAYVGAFIPQGETTHAVMLGGVLRSPGGVVVQPPSPTNPVLAGAAALGTTSYPVPAGALWVDADTGTVGAAGTASDPLRTVGAAIAAGASAVVLQGWTHESLSLSRAVTIQAAPNRMAGFDGSVVLSGWTNNGNGTWTAPYSITLARIDTTRFPLTTDPYGAHTDQVLVDGARLRQVADASTPGAGQFSVNQSTDTVTIGTNPGGKEVRAVDLKTAMTCSAVVSLLGIGVRRYSPQVVEGLNALIYFGGTSQGSIIENCVFSESAMVGINTARTLTFNRNTIRDNGYSGMQATTCNGSTFTNCAFLDNNGGLWKEQPATGAFKITRTTGFTFDSNYIRGVPSATGYWQDVNVQLAVVTNNVIMGGGTMTVGVNYEESNGGFYNGVQNKSIIANNHVEGCKTNMQILASGDVQIYNCEFVNATSWGMIIHQDRNQNSGNSGGATNQEDPWLVRGISVCNTRFSAASIQFFSYDDFFKQVNGTTMMDIFSGNWFAPEPGTMVQWGELSGARTAYHTPAALAARPDLAGKGWVQYQGTTAPNPSIAVPLPANVAAAIGVPVGTKAIGCFTEFLPTLIGA